MPRGKTAALVTLAMAAFAANSLFTRWALSEPGNDPLSFAWVRIGSGALFLAALTWKQRRDWLPQARLKAWVGALTLLSYALFFTLAYTRMQVGAGALIAFTSVQLTLLASAMLRGHRLRAGEWMGFALAFSGLVYLLLPGAQRPDLVPALWMILAGSSWGFYTLHGQKQGDATLHTAKNFLGATLLMLPVAFFLPMRLDSRGLGLALASGMLASALGYVLWYRALKLISTPTAAIVQLGVPPLAGVMGALWLGEAISARLMAASLLVLGGIYLKVQSAAR